jgi:hypothetical protein
MWRTIAANWITERGAVVVSYSSNGTRYRREIIASHPAGVILPSD